MQKFSLHFSVFNRLAFTGFHNLYFEFEK